MTNEYSWFWGMEVTLHGQSLVLKDIEAVLVALWVELLIHGGLSRGAQLPGPLQQSQIVLQRVAQVIAIAGGRESTMDTT